jgi:putative transcriptional regulator
VTVQFNKIDVKALRLRLNLSQSEFADRFDFSVGELRHWERGRRQPGRAARVLLTVIAYSPAAVDQALKASRINQAA